MQTEVLSRLLQQAVARSLEGHDRVTILFSGGLDSSLIAWLARGSTATAELLTISLPGGGDLARATLSAKLMGLPFRRVLLQEEEVLRAAREVRAAALGLALTDLSVQTAMLLALRHAASETVLCGQGADELFIGYAHSRRLVGVDLSERAERDLQKLIFQDLPITEGLASGAHKGLRTPYLDGEFMGAVSRIPWTERSAGGESKPLLRKMASELELPPEATRLPKKAFQYGTGIHKLLGRAPVNPHSAE